MAAAMNGLSPHGGFAPAGGTFLCFTDYARGRDADCGAVACAGVVYIMTHDSIGLGEDGPTHQPVEHLAALRAMPNLRVFRPADAVETAECWQMALEKLTGPTVLALSRQNLAPAAHHARAPKICAATAPMNWSRPKARPRCRCIASGSEVEIAVAAQKAAGRARHRRPGWCRCPRWNCCWSSRQTGRKAIIGNAPVKVAIEAAVRFGWDAVIGPDGDFIGMHGFGASAPAKELYKHFGITAEAVVDGCVKAPECGSSVTGTDSGL